MTIKLIVGLGNPGEKYLETRHNAGFWFIDDIVAQHHLHLNHTARYKGDNDSFTYQSEKRHILKPLTFMNNSGESVQALAHYFKIKPEEILVAHDELDLPAGTIRLKKSGGHGGHNGLRSIISHLGSKDFWRLRIGIGHPGDRNKVVDYVLNRISKKDAQLVQDALIDVMANIELLLSDQNEKFMNAVHTKK